MNEGGKEEGVEKELGGKRKTSVMSGHNLDCEEQAK